jgi:hypothetical protein
MLAASRGSDDLRFSLFFSGLLEDAIRRLQATDGHEVVDLLVAEVSVTGDDEEPIGNWMWIVDGVSAAARRIPRRDCIGCIRKWLGRIANESSKDIQYVLSLAIYAAIDRIGEREIAQAKNAISNAAADGRYSHVKSVLEDAVKKLTGLPSSRRTATGTPRDSVTNRYSVNTEALRREVEGAVRALRVGVGKDALQNVRMWSSVAATSELEGAAEELAWVLLDALTDAQIDDSDCSALTPALVNVLKFEPNGLTSQVIGVLLDAISGNHDLENRLINVMVALAPGLDSSQALRVARAFHAHLLSAKKTGEEHRRPKIESAIRGVARFMDSERFAEFCAAIGKEGDFRAVVCLASDRPEFTTVVEGFDSGSATWRCVLRRRDDKELLLGGGCELLAPKEIKRLLETEFAAPEEDSGKNQKISRAIERIPDEIPPTGHWGMKEIRAAYSERLEDWINALEQRLRRWGEQNCGNGEHQAKATLNRSRKKKETYNWRWPVFKVKEFAQELGNKYKE